MSKRKALLTVALLYTPVSEASREVANLTERKNPHTPVYGVKEFVCLSVCMLQTLTPIFSGPAKQNGLKKFRTSVAKTHVSNFYIYVHLNHLRVNCS